MATPKPPANKTRSPNYPAISLAEAIDRLKKIYATQKQYAAPRQVLAKLMGYNTLNGASATIVSALSKYGLIEGYGDNLHVSDLGRDLVIHRKGDPEYAEAVQTAAFTPTFFQEIREQYPYGLPSEHTMRVWLIKRGFNEKAISNAIRAYRDTIEFVEAEAGEPITELPDDSPPEMAMQTQTGTYKPESDYFPAPPVDPRVKSVQLPLSISEWATLQAAFPISEAAWKQMIAVLNAMKPALVAPSDSPSSVPVPDLFESMGLAPAQNERDKPERE